MSEREHKSMLRKRAELLRAKTQTVGRPKGTIDPKIGLRVKKLREDLGLYLWEVATKLDPPIWPQTLYKWELGHVAIRRDRLAQLANFFAVPVEHLSEGKRCPTRKERA